MTRADNLSAELVSVEANEQFTEAVMRFGDHSRLCFCHRVGERWAIAVGPELSDTETGLAGTFLSTMSKFRLNAKHLDIYFEDDSRWEQQIKSLSGKRSLGIEG